MDILIPLIRNCDLQSICMSNKYLNVKMTFSLKFPSIHQIRIKLAIRRVFDIFHKIRFDQLSLLHRNIL